MERLLASSLVAVMLAMAVFAAPTGDPNALSEPGTPGPLAAPMGLWEAYSRDLVSIHQVMVTYDINGNTGEGPLGYEISNSYTGEVLITEYAMLLSPNPRELFVSPITTQDGILTKTAVPASTDLVYGYGDFVAQGFLPGPSWWCTEERQFVEADVEVALGGEIAPFAMNPILDTSIPVTTQDNVWNTLKEQASPVVGKTVDDEFWEEIPDDAGQTLFVRLRATNLAIMDLYDEIPGDPSAPNAVVSDVIPKDWALDGGVTTPGFDLSANPDGSTTISWETSLPAANVTDFPSANQPTPYISRTFTYGLVTPNLPEGRIILPRATVDSDSNSAPEAHSAQPILDVFHTNDPPVADAGDAYEADEAGSITFSAAASTDPDGDPLTFAWDLDGDGVFEMDTGSDPDLTVAYGDDVSGAATVRVSDGEFTSTAQAPYIVRNLDPAIGDLRATSIGDLTLRVAGEKWHDVTLEVSQGGVSRSISVVRMPGSPDDQAATLEDMEISLTEELSITVFYTPDDDPVNGQKNGANPVWVIYDVGGSEVRLHHTFNVRQPDTYVWTLDDVAPDLFGAGITLAVDGSDVGSDDLTFEVDWGDANTSSDTVFNDGVGPDPSVSPEVSPISATAAFTHKYGEEGVYTVTVTLRDDDGGTSTATLEIGS